MDRSRRLPRLVDVAARAGVSLATASRALAGRDGVSAGVAGHVREIARELGYVANTHARTLAGGPTSTVGLIVNEIGDPYFSEIASGVLRLAGEHDLSVQICHSGRDPRHELAQIRSLVAHRVGVIVLAGSGYTDPRLQAQSRLELGAFEGRGGRASVIGRHFLGVDAVLPDNVAAGHAVADHLLSLGHRRVAVAAGPARLTTVVDRLAGVAAAVRRHGLPWPATPVVHADFTRAGGCAATEEIMREHPGTTAIIGLTDMMAIGAMSTLRSTGLAVPGDISVAGINDIAVAADLAPSLTTVRLPMAGMGELALELALREPSRRPRRKLTGHELVVRDSTAPPWGRNDP
ncbi:MAG TPA: LacI family DNA-binding transcriptional regulator [Pilimelia sp.]|nr:LacI family DNA-binding transcriptional regulator [Pilimelia sp.]